MLIRAPLLTTHLFVIVLFGQGALASSDTPSHHYYYFKESIPLNLDVTRVALSSRRIGFNQSLDRTLARVGILPQEVSQTPHRKWMHARVPAKSHTAPAVEQLVNKLARDRNVAFVSPIFLDRYGEPITITEDIIVRFSDDFSKAHAIDVLRQAARGQISERPWANMPNVYRLSCSTRNGFIVLALPTPWPSDPTSSSPSPTCFSRAAPP